MIIFLKKLNLYNNEIYNNIKNIINIPICYDCSYLTQSIILKRFKLL
jgi:hypothetical protein